MTFRRRLTLIVISIILVSIFVTGAISSLVINNYFKHYLSEAYEQKVEVIIQDTEKLLLGQLDEHDLNQYIKDPILTISIYDHLGSLLYYKGDKDRRHGRMNMPMFMNSEIDQFEVLSGGQSLGLLQIERSFALQDSETMFMFTMALFRGVGFAALIALVLSLFLSRRLSKGITKDLKDTAVFANSIELDNERLSTISKTSEIRSIQGQLIKLSRKLKMQNKIRKSKIDQIAHESKTPITILKSQLEGTLDGVLELDDKRLKSCLEAVNKLQVLTKDIALILETDEEELIVETSTFDLMEALGMIRTGLALQFERKGLSLVLEGPETLEISTDRNLLSVAIYNLLINALKFTHQGSVMIKVEKEPRKIIITDSGIGIKEEHLNKIFDPYYRAVPDEKYHGDGLGLYITKKNLKALGARITLRSQDGIGTRFEIHF